MKGFFLPPIHCLRPDHLPSIVSPDEQFENLFFDEVVIVLQRFPLQDFIDPLEKVEVYHREKMSMEVTKRTITERGVHRET